VTNPSSYGVVKLNDYVYFQEGPGIRNSQNTSEGVRFLNIRCFVDGRLDTASMKKVSENDAYGKYKHFLLDVGDYVVSSSGTLGRIAEVYPEDIPVMLNTSTIRFRPIKKEFLDRLYLRYFLESEVFQQQVKSLATGSVQLNYGPSHLAFVEMPLPPIKSQRAIGEVLDNLTKQISLNHALSKTLEDIAQTIFKSWFIDFDPVKAKMNGEKPKGMDDETAALFPDSFEESELGLIPKGWNVQSLDEISDYLNGLAMQRFPVTDEENQLPVIKIAQLRAGNTSGADIASGLIDSRFVIKDGDILFSWSGTLEVETWAGGPGALNQHLFKVSGKTVPDWFSYLSTKYFLTFFRQIASSKATTMGHIQRSHLSESKIALPSKVLMKRVSELLEPLITKKVNSLIESRTLAEIRDSLLPRLISGELEIPEEMLAS
jgi:type I restriction enzyme S subunit